MHGAGAPEQRTDCDGFLRCDQGWIAPHGAAGRVAFKLREGTRVKTRSAEVDAESEVELQVDVVVLGA